LLCISIHYNKLCFLFLRIIYSGLDIVAIKQCVSLLVDLAKQGRTVVCTIHQPSSSLFHMFDHVYMLARGSCIYNGSPKQLVPFLAQVGHVCKPTHNPADFGMVRLVEILLYYIMLDYRVRGSDLWAQKNALETRPKRPKYVL